MAHLSQPPSNGEVLQQSTMDAVTTLLATCDENFQAILGNVAFTNSMQGDPVYNEYADRMRRIKGTLEKECEIRLETLGDTVHERTRAGMLRSRRKKLAGRCAVLHAALERYAPAPAPKPAEPEAEPEAEPKAANDQLETISVDLRAKEEACETIIYGDTTIPLDVRQKTLTEPLFVRDAYTLSRGIRPPWRCAFLCVQVRY